MKNKIISVFLVLVLLFSMICTFTVSAGNYYFLWPVPSCHEISAGFDDGRNHNAIDIPASRGSQVIAAANGVVTYVNASCTHNYGKSYNCCNSIGRVIKIQHYITVNGQNVVTRYGHLTDIYVQEGEYVTAGQVIGTVGSTGYSTGNHLDFKMYMGDTVIDPGPYLQVPSDLTYTGSDWANNGEYINRLRSYGNTTYGGDVAITAGNLYTVNGTAVYSNISVTSSSAGVHLDGSISFPLLILRGSDVEINGNISSSTIINSATVYILNTDGSVKYSKSADVNAYAYNLANLSGKLWFRLLPAGDYIYAVTATDSGGEHTLLYRSFIVSQKDTMVAGSDCSYPVCLKPNESFTIKGTVISASTINSLTAEIISEDGGTMYSGITVTPGSATYNLKNVDTYLKFNKLPEGKFRYYVVATDSVGNTVTVIDKSFYVNSKELVTGEATVSGLGYFGASGSSLASPYVGNTLTADTDLSNENATLSYSWYADDVLLQNETGNTLYISPSLKGKKISLSVTPTGNYFGEIIGETTQVVTTAQEDIATILEKEYTYAIDVARQTVGPMLAGTTARQLMDGVLSTDLFTGCYDIYNNRLADDDLVGTGCSLRQMLLDSIVILKYYIVVMGDVNSDGKVTAADARAVLRHSAELQDFANCQIDAADVDFNGKVTAGDARKILRVAADLDTLAMP